MSHGPCEYVKVELLGGPRDGEWFAVRVPFSETLRFPRDLGYPLGTPGDIFGTALAHAAGSPDPSLPVPTAEYRLQWNSTDSTQRYPSVVLQQAVPERQRQRLLEKVAVLEPLYFRYVDE